VRCVRSLWLGNLPRLLNGEVGIDRNLSLAKRAIILHEGSLETRELRLARILDFFGIPWQPVKISGVESMQDGLDCVAFGSVRAVAAALNHQEAAGSPVSQLAAFYAYATGERGQCLDSLRGDLNLSLEDAPQGKISLRISEKLPEIAGPMAGLEISLRLQSDDAILAGIPSGKESAFAAIISTGSTPVFLRFARKGAPIFFCASSGMVDIDQPVKRGFYDVKEHFCSAVPLLMFIRCMFPETGWLPQELGACLIIDDPLLRPRYGFCNFPKLRDLMRQHRFTTNIAFIPWNWRRTSPSASAFFRNESELFSVSIHGCDHTAREFGTTSLETLHTTARLAQSRMRNHRARTGVQHDSVMVFPQGVFSSACPAVLQRHDFLAAVNTEILPVDSQNDRTRIRDVWDVAIMAYGGFPVFTRRYASHGLENFAFDLLLGKPCLIVAHHDSFRDGGMELIELIGKIESWNYPVRWRPLGDVLRRACRRRVTETGAEEIDMYGTELVATNPTNQMIEIKVRRRSNQEDPISQILCDDKPIDWACEAGYLSFSEKIAPHGERRFRLVYGNQNHAETLRRSLRFELSVAARRILCELRDEYVVTSPLLNASTHRLRQVLRKAAV